jgi:outer membrane immunogenic protein
MKKTLLAIALTASFTGSALAADLPMKAARPMAEPIVAANWTGCYLGAGAGYGMWNQEHITRDPILGTPVAGQVGSVTSGGRGWFGTVQVGCDYQFAQRWVIGAFADYDFGSIKGNFTPAASPAGLVGEEKLKSSWAAGGRIGYLVVPQLLTYVSGGYTQARFDAVNFIGGPVGSTTVMDAQTYKGWFIGSGVEYGIDFLPGLFWKTEYRYAQYDAESPAITRTSLTAGTAIIGFEDSKKYVQTIRSELVYRFNFGGGPVVARY